MKNILLKVMFYVLYFNKSNDKYDYFDLIIIYAFVWRAINFN